MHTIRYGFVLEKPTNAFFLHDWTVLFRATCYAHRYGVGTGASFETQAKAPGFEIGRVNDARRFS